MSDGERRQALARERAAATGLSAGRGRRRATTAPQPARPAKRSRRRTAALAASGSAVALVACLAMAPPATADPIETIDAAASGRVTAQHLTVSAVVASAGLDRDDPVASAVAGIIAGHGGAAGERAADAIVNALAAGGTREKIVATALTYLGDPYVLDGADHSGIDCSGLVMQAYAAVGVRLGHLVHLQDDAGTRIDEADARPGDLVVFDDDEHIALYLGGGMIVQAPEVGRPVEVTTVWSGVPHHFTTLLGATQ